MLYHVPTGMLIPEPKWKLIVENKDSTESPNITMATIKTRRDKDNKNEFHDHNDD